MLQRRSDETLDYFIRILGNVPEGMLVKLSNSPSEPNNGTWYNVLPGKTSLTWRKYNGDADAGNGISFDGKVRGLNIDGYDMDDKVNGNVFFPHLTGVQVYVPQESNGFGQLFGAMLEGVGNMIGLTPQTANSVKKLSVSEQPVYETVLSPEDFARSYELLLSAKTDNMAQVTSESRIASLKFNNGQDWYDLLVTEVVKTPDGIIVGARDLAEYLGEGITTQMRARMLIGETVPAASYQVHFLIENLEGVVVQPAREYASTRLFETDIFKPVAEQKFY